MKKLFIMLLALLGSLPVLASPYPSTLYSSDRVPDSLRGIEIGKIFPDSTSKTDVVAMGVNTAYLYKSVEGVLNKYLIYKGNKFEEWMRLSLFDVDGDGDEELLVAGFENGSLSTKVLFLEGDKLVQKGEYRHYAVRIKWMGQDILVGQKKLGDDDYTGPLLKLRWDGKKLLEEGELVTQWGVSGEADSLFRLSGFNLNNQRQLLTLKPSGKLVLYNDQSGKWKQGWISGTEYGGSVLFYNLEIKNALNMTTDNRFYIPVRFNLLMPGEEFPQLKKPVYTPQPLPTEPAPALAGTPPVDLSVSAPIPVPVAQSRYTSPQVYVMKNEGYLKNVIGAVPAVKSTQMVRLGWTGYGFQEEWNSPRLDGAITDFTVADWDGDGKEEIIATFLLRDKGYLDTLKKQDSLIIVLKPDR